MIVSTAPVSGFWTETGSILNATFASALLFFSATTGVDPVGETTGEFGSWAVVPS